MIPIPHAKIPMMSNKILQVKHTNKGHLGYSNYCAWAWSSSHSNFAFFFFTWWRAFFLFHFCLGCSCSKFKHSS
jgi:hypothetical protein